MEKSFNKYLYIYICIHLYIYNYKYKVKLFFIINTFYNILEIRN